MTDFEELLETLAERLGGVDEIEEPVRGQVLELLDVLGDVHHAALLALAEALGAEILERVRGDDPAIAWMLDAYAIGVDERAAADAALAEIRPYIHSHGGEVEVLEVERGVVRLRLSGTCSGCTASAVTLKEGIERALRDRFAGFVSIDVEEDQGEPHPPPGPTLLQIEPRPDW